MSNEPIPFSLAPNKEHAVTVSKVEVTYWQEGENGPDELVLSTHDMGGGRFFTLKTEPNSRGWAFETVEELTTVINDFIARCGEEIK